MLNIIYKVQLIKTKLSKIKNLHFITFNLTILNKNLRNYRQIFLSANILFFKEKIVHANNLNVFQKCRKLLKVEQARLKETKRQIVKWKKKNDKLSKEIKWKSSEVEEHRRLFDDPCRKKDKESRKTRLAAIARRTKLIMKLENNYEQLLILHARLEVLKLRTYPTLQLKTA